ncbi:DUF3413 domain-containing protein [Celerinatantimonas sp. YJH-8]|uniref:DUF3413 domain-containing protein n=1 Tax=Celerinatantimonas sp. YJH-8 TaxID=3228714 RepID=UPI0038C714E0
MVQGSLTYRDKVSQLISWGHWFCLGNIAITLLVAIRYLTIAHWPDTTLGQGYMLISWLGQFSFLPFIVFLLTLFPLSFLLPSNRTMCFIGAIIATTGISALAIDTQVFARFYVHLTPMLWQLLIDKENNRQGTDVNLMFILVPLFFFMELLLARICWLRFRRLERKHIGKPIAIVFFICFFLTHVVHVWADATIYRPITAQKINYPLFYPMTARNLLNSYGLIDVERIREQSRQDGVHNGNPLNYPEQTLHYQNQSANHLNLLIIMVEGLRADSLDPQLMPETYQFSHQTLRYQQHFSGSNQHTLGVYSLFYGLPTSYWKSIHEAEISPVLMDGLRQRGYEMGIFSSNPFDNSDLRTTVWNHVPEQNLHGPQTQEPNQVDADITNQWLTWQAQTATNTPWFSYLDLNSVVNLSSTNAPLPHKISNITQWVSLYRNAVKQTDVQIGRILKQLEDSGALAHTVVMITSDHGQEFADQQSNRLGYGNNFSRFQTEVPLLIYWPDKAPETIHVDTSHLDVAATLSKHLLGIQNRLSDYTIGNDLFAPITHRWIIIGDEDEQAIYQPDQITVLTSNGNYETRDRNYRRKHLRADMPVILQVLNELRRFYQDNS